MAAPPPDYKQIARQKARQYGVPVDVFLRQIGQESGWNPNARSGAGAEGIAQFIPSTAKAYGLSNPYDPVASLDAAARYDAALLHQYGTIERALSAYNSGRPDAYKDPGFAKGQTYRYVKSILDGVAPTAAAAPVAGAALPSSAPPAAAAPSSFRAPDLFNVGNQLLGLPQLTAPVPTSARSVLAQVIAPQPVTEAPVKPVRGSTLKQLQAFAQPFGLSVTSTTGGQHAKGSYHYQGRAVDLAGDAHRMAALANAALQHPKDFREVIYTGPGSSGYVILRGRVTPASKIDKALFQQHTNHVHLAR